VNRIGEIERLLAKSSDGSNPTAEVLVELFRDVQRIAVVGLSRDLEKPARRVPSYLAAKGFDVIPVNPKADRLLGQKSWRSLDEVPEPVDMVVVFRPSAEAAAVVEQATSRPDQPVIWLPTGIRAPEAVEAARAAGHTVVQDVCVFQVCRVLVG
jgi:predicted CoA-binding protein